VTRIGGSTSDQSHHFGIIIPAFVHPKLFQPYPDIGSSQLHFIILDIPLISRPLNPTQNFKFL